MSSQDILSWIMEHDNQSITDEYELQEVNNKLGALKKAIEMAEKM